MLTPSFHAKRPEKSFFRWLLFVGIITTSAMLFGCAKKPGNRLVVGMELSSPPFEMTDEHNQPTGISVEFARALADGLHKELVIENLKFGGLIPALKTGKIDLILSSMTVNEERAKAIDFSDPYVRVALCLLAGKDSPVRSGADLNDPARRVVVKSATTGADYARTNLPRAQIIQVSEEAACVLEVIQGKADAFIYDQLSVYQLQKRNPGTTRAIYQPLRNENWAIGIRKNNGELRAGVNAFIAEYKAKRGLEQLAEKYLHDKQALAEMGDPFSF